MISREYLYRECNIHQKTISVHFFEPKLIDDKEYSFITVMCVDANEGEEKYNTSNILQDIDTYGSISVKYFIMPEGPYHLHTEIINTNKIKEFEY